jgi:hypothetical protein
LLGLDQWNLYYIRAINGEIRLWVNGDEVSGGNEWIPVISFIASAAEGTPIDFGNLKIRVLR